MLVDNLKDIYYNVGKIPNLYSTDELRILKSGAYWVGTVHSKELFFKALYDDRRTQWLLITVFNLMSDTYISVTSAGQGYHYRGFFNSNGNINNLCREDKIYQLSL